MFKSGYVALVGLPNIGKSTLLNRLLGVKLSIVTPKPQTTRHRILGIMHRPETQILFLDTPGIHRSKKKLNTKIVQTAYQCLKEADVVCHLIPPHLPREQDQRLFEYIQPLKKKYFVLINKVDQVDKQSLLPLLQQVHEKWQPDEIVPISALKGVGCEVLPSLIEKYLGEGPAYFPEDQYTEHDIRFLCEEMVREKAMRLLHQEIPYGLTTQVEKFEEKEKNTHIHLSIIVERDSHKGIVLGAKGQKIQQIGQQARRDIENLVGRKVFLELFVKVISSWSEQDKHLREFGI